MALVWGLFISFFIVVWGLGAYCFGAMMIITDGKEEPLNNREIIYTALFWPLGVLMVIFNRDAD